MPIIAFGDNTTNPDVVGSGDGAILSAHPGTPAQTGGGQATAQGQGMSTTTKYLLGAAAVLALGGLVWAVTKKPALKANKGSRKACPACGAKYKKHAWHCHKCGELRANGGKRKHARRMHANKPFAVYRAKEEPIVTGIPTVQEAAHYGEMYGKDFKTIVFDQGQKGYGKQGRFVAMFQPNAGKKATKRAPGWQKKLYHGKPTAFRTHAPPKYARYGATLASHYAFPEAFKYPIHGKDVATTKRFIRTAASRFAKFKMRIEAKYRAAVERRIEAAKKKYGIGEFNPKYARKTATKKARRKSA